MHLRGNCTKGRRGSFWWLSVNAQFHERPVREEPQLWFLLSVSGELTERISISSSFSGRMAGGRSGDMDTLREWFFRCLVPLTQLSRWARSTDLTMMPAFAFWDRRWQAAKAVASASGTFRTVFAMLTHAWRVSAPSLAFPSIPWITGFHLRRWTSSSSCLRARASARWDMWAVMAGSIVVMASSRRSLVACMECSRDSNRSLIWTSCVSALSILASWVPTASLTAHLMAASSSGLTEEGGSMMASSASVSFRISCPWEIDPCLVLMVVSVFFFGRISDRDYSSVTIHFSMDGMSRARINAPHPHKAQSLATNSPAPGPRPLTCGVSSECLGTRSYETTSRDQRGKIQMFFSSIGACTAAKFPIANHHSQIITQLYSALFIRLIWQQGHSDSEFDALKLSVYCKFWYSKRCWQRYSAASDLCLFDWLGVESEFLWMLADNFHSMSNMSLLFFSTAQMS